MIKQKNKSSKNKLKFKNINFFNILLLHLVIMIYTFATVFAKFASNYEFLSPKFIMFYSLEIIILGVYAIFWQQVIKKFPLSIAYANRAVSLIWSVIWAILFFNEQVTINNLIGVIIVLLGTVFINLDE